MKEMPGSRKTYVAKDGHCYIAAVECDDLDDMGNLRFDIVKNTTREGGDTPDSWIIDEWVSEDYALEFLMKMEDEEYNFTCPNCDCEGTPECLGWANSDTIDYECPCCGFMFQTWVKEYII